MLHCRGHKASKKLNSDYSFQSWGNLASHLPRHFSKVAPKSFLGMANGFDELMTLLNACPVFSIVEFIPGLACGMCLRWDMLATCCPDTPCKNCRQWNVFFPTMNPQGKAHLCYLEIHMDPSHLENDLTVSDRSQLTWQGMSTLSRLLHSMNLRVVRFESQALSPIGVYIVKNRPWTGQISRCSVQLLIVW